MSRTLNENLADVLPVCLKHDARFCVWSFADVGGRRTKVPLSPHGGAAKTNDPSTFSDFDTALKCYERHSDKYAGLGILLDGDLCGIDIDHCIDEAGELSNLARDIVGAMGTYAETSPSGTGLRLICRAEGIGEWYSTAQYKMKDTGSGLEVYIAGHTNRFVTVTGNRFNDEEVNERSDVLREILDKYLRREAHGENAAPVEIAAMRQDADELDTLDDERVIRQMLSAKNGEKVERLWNGDFSGYGSQSEADLALCNVLAFWTWKNAAQMDRLFRQSDLMRPKWDERHGAETYGEMTIRRAIAGCKEVWSPSYRECLVANTEDVADAIAWLQSSDVANAPRYAAADDLAASFLLADFLRPTARFCDDAKVWFAYQNGVWRKDSAGCVVAERAKTLARAIGVYAGGIPDDSKRKTWLKLSERWCSPNTRKALLADAASVWKISRADFDTDPWLLVLENGILDLKTLTVRPHDSDALCTKQAHVCYDPNAAFLRWESFVQEIFPDDGETLDFIQRWLGYSMCGDLSEEKMVMCHGKATRNGKSTLLESVGAVLGDYCLTMNPESLCESSRFADGRGPSEDVARLGGARFVIIPEPKRTMRLDASRVKQLTGGDKMNARFLGENSFDFRSVAHLTMNANHIPDVDDQTVFWSNRILVVPFTRHFGETEQDSSLKRQFSTEVARSAILNWLIAGLRKYQHDRLKQSPAMLEALSEYRSDCDKISRFISDCIRDHSDPRFKLALAIVYDDYKSWCASCGCCPEARNKFAAELAARGIQIGKDRPSCGGNPTRVIYGKDCCFTLDDLAG